MSDTTNQALTELYDRAFKAGREAGLREASGIVEPSYNQYVHERAIIHALQMKADAILAAIDKDNTHSG